MWSGSSPSSSHAPRTASCIGTVVLEDRDAVLAAPINSFSDVATPPRVGSRIQRIPGAHVSSNASTNGHTHRVSDTRSASKSNSPRANRIVMPCAPIGPESSTRSPGRMLAESSVARPSIKPIPNVDTYMPSAFPCSTTFVSPPTMETPRLRAAIAIASISPSSVLDANPASRISVAISASGFAPKPPDR